MSQIKLYSIHQKFKLDMEPMEDQNCAAEFEEVYSLNKSTDDMIFDQITMELQEIMISPQFQKSLTTFMRDNWNIFDQKTPKEKEAKVFAEYRNQMRNFLQNNIRRKVQEFQWNRFNELLKTRKNIIDQQILDTLLSLEDVEHFKAFIKDYRNSYEEEEMFKVLTIKSNKITENKTVKGKDNIFNSSQQTHGFGDKNLKALPKKKQVKQKTEGELLVPELILTVKPIRKG